MGLFDDEAPQEKGPRPARPPQGPPKSKEISTKKEATSLERLRNLDEKIAGAIDKVKLLKEEKSALLGKIDGLEKALREKDEIIRELSAEKTAIKTQIEDLLGELDTIGAD